MAYGLIYDDLKNTGKCRIFIAKEQFSPNACSFATAKSDPMAKILSDEYVTIICPHSNCRLLSL